MANPRRKVASAKQLHGHVWQTRWVCRLEGCGHKVHVTGRHPVWPALLPSPPMTASCYECGKAVGK